MMPEIYPNFRTSYAGHIDGLEVLDHKVYAMTRLTSVDPSEGYVIVHVKNMQKRDANGIRNQRVRITLYGHDDETTEAIAEVLHAAICGSSVVIPCSELNQEQTFYDFVNSEQAPTENESPGLTSASYVFDLSVLARSIA